VSDSLAPSLGKVSGKRCQLVCPSHGGVTSNAVAIHESFLCFTLFLSPLSPYLKYNLLKQEGDTRVPVCTAAPSSGANSQWYHFHDLVAQAKSCCLCYAAAGSGLKVIGSSQYHLAEMSLIMQGMVHNSCLASSLSVGIRQGSLWFLVRNHQLAPAVLSSHG